MRVIFGIYCLITYVYLSANSYGQDLSTIKPFLDEQVKEGKVAGGSVLVYHKGKTIFYEGFGYFDIESQTAFKPDSPVVIASISKPVLGTALHKLSDSGKLDLNAGIDKYFPAIAVAKLQSGETVNRAPTTIELLTHTAGIINDESKGGRIWFQSWVRNKSLEYVMDKVIAENPFRHHPGLKTSYSGVGTDIAARVGEISSGLPRNKMLQVYFAEPLGMKDTFYRDKAGLELRKLKMPTRYHISKVTGKLNANRVGNLPESDTYASSGGSVVSTAQDLLKWMLMIRNSGKHNGVTYLLPNTLNAMLTKNKVGNAAAGGLWVRESDAEGKALVLGHTGSSGTSIWIDLKNDIIGIILTQTKGSDFKPVRLELEKRIHEALLN
jgi:CubicO group peptidase (beta-lactamase class C family)